MRHGSFISASTVRSKKKQEDLPVGCEEVCVWIGTSYPFLPKTVLRVI